MIAVSADLRLHQTSLNFVRLHSISSESIRLIDLSDPGHLASNPIQIMAHFRVHSWHFLVRTANPSAHNADHFGLVVDFPCHRTAAVTFKKRTKKFEENVKISVCNETFITKVHNLLSCLNQLDFELNYECCFLKTSLLQIHRP